MSTQDIKNTSLFAVDQASCMNNSEEQEARTTPTVSPLTDAVPSGWLQMRNKDVFRYVSRPVGQKWSEFELLTMGKAGVSIRDVESGKGKFPSSFETYQEVRPGDFVFCLFDMDETPRTVGLSSIGGMITGAYDVFYADSGYERFLYYWYLAVDDQKAWKPYYRSLRKTITRDMFMTMRVLVPPRSEAARIAEYLDRESQRIEELKDSIRAQIDALEAYKRSVSFDAVTGRLDRVEKVNDPRIAWLGNVPRHWRIEKIKFHVTRNERKGYPDEPVLSLYRELGLVYKDSRDDNHNVTSADTSPYKLVTRGNLVINKMKAWQGSVAVSQLRGIVSPAYYVYKIDSLDLRSEYLHYLLRSSYKDEFRRMSGGIREGQWDLPAASFENTYILIPPVHEQEEIVAYLDRRLEAIDASLRAKEGQLAILDEYKNSLIYEIVTGKREVPVR